MHLCNYRQIPHEVNEQSYHMYPCLNIVNSFNNETLIYFWRGVGNSSVNVNHNRLKANCIQYSELECMISKGRSCIKYMCELQNIEAYPRFYNNIIHQH